MTRSRLITTAALLVALALPAISPAQDGGTQATDQEAAQQQFEDLVEKMKEFAVRLREHGQEEKAALVENALKYADDKKVSYVMSQAKDLFRSGKLQEGKRLAGDLRTNLDDILAILEKRSALSDLDRRRREIADARKELAALAARESELKKQTEEARDKPSVDPKMADLANDIDKLKEDQAALDAQVRRDAGDERRGAEAAAKELSKLAEDAARLAKLAEESKASLDPGLSKLAKDAAELARRQREAAAKQAALKDAEEAYRRLTDLLGREDAIREQMTSGIDAETLRAASQLGKKAKSASQAMEAADPSKDGADDELAAQAEALEKAAQ